MDPFERGRIEGERLSVERLARQEKTEAWLENIATPLLGALQRRFLEGGFQVRATASSLHISTRKMEADTDAQFDVSAPFIGSEWQHFSVSDRFGPADHVTEYVCTEERVLELAGRYFGRASVQLSHSGKK